uniref:NADH-ubiquinone oxidoreductase chain 2 n=1 Tax=Ornithodoros brasiliensis TaxID=888526 RepID=W0FDJ5_ORNBR|nr:NADH dehydrogenase subunit 2 [Ornithodoros brasiliensis]AHF21678.1 NADH dehydrogenase subunit 2 [Ornithodoros brasiliensis]QZP40881.1 NADH dehydrogenase subunit 2 [Ornithodoros brasiliensis]
MKTSNVILLWTLMMSIIMALSSSSLFLLWMSLEINMMSFIPMMNSKNMMSINSMIMYFIIQAMASSLFIFVFSWILINHKLILNMTSLFISCSMLIKIGAAPFHIWFPQISEGVSMFSFLLLSTIQKMIPLYIISMFPSMMTFLSIFMSASIGSLGGLNQFSLRKILAFSSITHMSWMLSLTLLTCGMWIIYLLIYSIIMLLIIQIMNQFSLSIMNSMKNMYKTDLLYFILIFLSLGGLPPMMGFFMKWMALKIILMDSIILTIPLILSSLVNLYFYIRVSYPIFLKNYNLNIWNTKYMNKFNLFMILNFMTIFLIVPFL